MNMSIIGAIQRLYILVEQWGASGRVQIMCNGDDFYGMNSGSKICDTGAIQGFDALQSFMKRNRATGQGDKAGDLME